MSGLGQQVGSLSQNESETVKRKDDFSLQTEVPLGLSWRLLSPFFPQRTGTMPPCVLQPVPSAALSLCFHLENKIK